MNEQAVVIEDDEDLSFIFAEALRAAGFQTSVVLDGNQAMERLSQVQPSLIILDLHLPHVAGTDILKRIRESEKFKDVRVVVTTADARLAEQAEGQADVVLIKPISFVLLRDLAARLSTNFA
mgnify:CR=1 FL=1